MSEDKDKIMEEEPKDVSSNEQVASVATEKEDKKVETEPSKDEGKAVKKEETAVDSPWCKHRAGQSS